MPWMAIVPIAMAAASAVVTAIGAQAQGRQQATADKYNAAVEEQKATTAQEVGDAQAGQIQLQTRSDIAQQQAAYAAGGLDMSGSPLLVMSNTASQGALKSALTQWQGQTQSTADLQQAQMDQFNAKSAMSAANFNTTATILTGAAQTTRQAGQMYAGSDAGTSPLVGADYGAANGFSMTSTGRAAGPV